MALLIWAPDHRGNHVYALSLPVPRWRYTLLRLAAGAVLLAPAVLALWIGALVATGVSTIPVGLHAYPATIAARFAVALLLAYALFFALASGTMRTTVILLGIVPVALLTLNAFLVLVGGPNLLAATARWIGGLPGPFRLMFDAWLLINV
jgi:ABC-type transport system involved in multi-copper enzyme maturation permease subunit